MTNFVLAVCHSKFDFGSPTFFYLHEYIFIFYTMARFLLLATIICSLWAIDRPKLPAQDTPSAKLTMMILRPTRPDDTYAALVVFAPSLSFDQILGKIDHIVKERQDFSPKLHNKTQIIQLLNLVLRIVQFIFQGRCL